MKLIKLTQGQYAIVDDVDYTWLNQWKWYAANFRGHFYAARKRKGRMIYMTREILGLGRKDKRQVDHRDHNTLNNRRANIRICSHRQNLMNRKSVSNTSSQFKGVCWLKIDKRWQAAISIKGKTSYLGYFVREEEAALAYDIAATKEYGEFARLNFPLTKNEILIQ